MTVIPDDKEGGPMTEKRRRKNGKEMGSGTIARTLSRRNRRCSSKEAGQVLVLTALAIFVLIGFVALAADIGFYRFKKRDMQKAADAGAIGGAYQLIDGGNVADWAKYDTKKNGYDDAAGDVIVIVNNPPQNAEHVEHTTDQYVEVIVEQDQPTFFAKIFNINSVKVSARAIAYGGLEYGPGLGCIYALSPDAEAGVHVSGNNTEVNVNCNVYVNSTHDNALLVSGNSELYTTGIGVVGGSDTDSAEAVTPPPGTEGFTEGIESVDDPLKNKLPPAPLIPPEIACDHPDKVVVNSSGSLDPGVYCGGIHVTGSGLNITFNPGLYTIYGGGFRLDSGNSTVTGYGVTFYNSGTEDTYGSIVINANAITDLRATPPDQIGQGNPPSIPAMLFWQPEENTSIATFDGNSGTTLEGYIYLPGAENVKFTGGNSTQGSYTTVIAQTVKFAGNSTFTFNNYVGGGSGGESPPIPKVVLVE